MRRFWANLIGNQLVWLCAVAGAGRGWQWPALLAASLYIGSQLLTSPHPRLDLRLMVLALACAWLVDASAAASGTVHYAAAPLGWAPPPWILALWAAFAMTLTTSMRFLQRHPVLPALFGLLLAPLAYLSAARGFDAVQFTAPAWQGLLVLGAGWSIALSLLCQCARRGSRTPSPPPAGRSTVMSHLLWVLLYSVLMMSWGWAWQRRRQNIGVVDVLWAKGVAVSAVLLALLGEGALMPRVALGVLGGLWGSRLALHLWHRVRSEPEDGRYRYLREHWQGHQGKIFGFFMAQALLVLLFALPFVAVASNPQAGVTGWIVGAGLVWLLSVGGEALADRQLARFRADPANKGRTCREGLWRYSRHPNYFFEWLHWFSYVLLAVGSPLWWLAWTGPLLMYVFLRYLSGVPFTEKQALRSRGDDYRAYQRSTPMFFPWFPHSSKEHSA